MTDENKTKTVAYTARETAIARSIADLAKRIYSDVAAQATARDEMKEYAANEATTRIEMCEIVAEASAKDNWTLEEIAKACGLAANLPIGNHAVDEDQSTKTIGVFCSELGVYAHPKMRDNARTLIEACMQALKEEKDRDTGDKPVSRFQSNLYKLAITLARKERDGDVRIRSAEDVVQYAKDNDPRKDAARIAKQIANVTKSLKRMFEEFYHTDLQLAAQFLESIKAEDLMSSRTAMLKAIEDASKKPETVTATVTTPTPAPVTPSVKPAERENNNVMSGAADIDELMQDQAA